MADFPTPQTHYRSCNLCEAMCGLEINYQGREIHSIKGDKKDPFSRGHICPKAVALKDIYEDKDRLKQPLRKTPSGWEIMSWEDAFEEVGKRLKQVREKYGNDAVGTYQGNPSAHNLGTMLYAGNFIRSLKTKNRFTATSADQLPHHFAGLSMFGHYLLLPIPDVDRTEFLLLFGANPLVSNGSLMTAPDIGKRLRAIQKRGGKIVVVDPRRTETAAKADEHIFIRPGQDALLLLALVHTIFEEGLSKPGRLTEFTDGFEKVETVAKHFSPERVAAKIGIAASAIRQLAREFASAKRAVCYGRMGVSTQAFGGLCQWLVNVLNIITGNFDREGGAMFTLPAFDQVAFLAATGKVGSIGRWSSRVNGFREFSGELPVAAMAAEMLTKGDGQIKAMVTIAGNPVLSTPNGTQLEKGLSQLDFMLAIDIYLNETTRHADIILPPATGLETSHYDLVFNVLAIRNTTKYSPPLFEIEAHQRYDWQIFKALTHEMTGKPDDGTTPELMLDFALQSGPYKSQGISLEKLKDEPHGIDLGPLRPCLPRRLFTPDKRINLAPEIICEDIQRLKEMLSNTENGREKDFPFLLIGRRQLRSNNSWMHNSERLVKGKNRCTVLLNPQDARRLSIQDGQQVEVSSKAGTIQIATEITEDILEGVLSIPHGWGHHREGIQLAIAQKNSGASINDLTDHNLVDVLTGNAAFSGVPVKIQVKS